MADQIASLEGAGTVRPAAGPGAPTFPDALVLRFDPRLVSRLTQEHRDLLERCGRIRGLSLRADWRGAHDELRAFRDVLCEHLLAESVKLYTYVQVSAKADDERLQLMRQLSVEMSLLGRHLLEFIDRQGDLMVHVGKQAAFGPAWQAIGEGLSARLAREERLLFPLYRREGLPSAASPRL